MPATHLRARGVPMALAAVLACGVAAREAAAQPLATPTPFVIVNQERLLTGSQRGQALLAAEEEARDRLRAEARAIEAAFEAEERELTEARARLDPEAFRALADEFDARVVAARREQDARAAALAQEFDAGRRRFYAAVAPILVRLMERSGAYAILDENTVLLAAQELQITDAAIAAIDAAPVEEPLQDAPGDLPDGPPPADAPEVAPAEPPAAQQ